VRRNSLVLIPALVAVAGLLGTASVAAAPPPTVSRIFGADRFETSAAIAAKRTTAYASGDGVIYVASGLNFPDALAAAPAAAFQDGELLLTAPDALPASVQSQIVRLHPDRIVVVGGPASVSNAVLTQLESLAPNVVRLGGVDRYDTARMVVMDAFGENITSDYAYVATGRNFPDALSAAAVAGVYGSPVLLIDGLAGSLDGATESVLSDLAITDVVLLGGTGTVSSGIQASIDALPFIDGVTRYGGADRYETSALLNASWILAGQDDAFIATGENFADALSGAAYAARLNAPLYLSPKNCLTRPVFEDLLRVGPDHVTLFGSTASLGTHVELLNPCDELE
jgi:putative cell wall-binding protein